MIKIHPARRLYLLIERYKRFPPNQNSILNSIPTLNACEKGRMDDVELFVNILFKYIVLWIIVTFYDVKATEQRRCL